MTLDKNDIETLRQMMREELDSAFSSEPHASAEIEDSNNRLMTYMESHVEKKLDVLIANVQEANKRIDRTIERMDETNEAVRKKILFVSHNPTQDEQPHSELHCLIKQALSSFLTVGGIFL